MTKKLFLITNPNGNIRANFNYELAKPQYTFPLAYQFAEQQKKLVSRKFNTDVYLKIGGTLTQVGDSIQMFFPIDFSNITVEEIKNQLRELFPVIIVKEE